MLLLIKRLSITCGEMTYGCSNFLGLDLFKKITLYPTNLQLDSINFDKPRETPETFDEASK